jgi:hypothetical protein
LFLAALKREGPTDLILNGDTFELWQSIRNDCRYSQEDLGCTEMEARRRIDHVLNQHRGEIQELADFASTGSNTLTIVPGNHDAALLFESVARAVFGSLQLPSERVRILRAGFVLSADGMVYVEHGHQIGSEVNRFKGWPNPFIRRRGRTHLRRPWGEQFVQAFYNDFERKYPIIDNISDDRAAIRYGMAAEGLLRTALDSAEFVEFFLLDVSWRQMGQALGGESGSGPVWDERAIRRQGSQFIVESFPAGDPLRALMASAASSSGLPLSVDDLSTEQIRLICDHRAALAERNKTRPRPEFNVTRCPTDPPEALGAIAQNLAIGPDAVYGSHLKNVVATLGLGERPFEVFVYSHTHVADPGFNPLRRERLGWDPVVVNTGAWQRVISHEMLTRLQVAPKEVLKMPLESLPACYSVVWIGPYMQKPKAQLRWWRMGSDGAWGFGESCEP